MCPFTLLLSEPVLKQINECTYICCNVHDVVVICTLTTYMHYAYIITPLEGFAIDYILSMY